MRADLTPGQIRLLWALERYRLLNIDQMRRIGVGRDRGTLAGSVDVLVRKHLVRGTSHELIAGFDHLPALYWLTERGAAELGAMFPDEPAPLGARRKLKTWFHIKHRIMQVEIHIALRAWAASADVDVGWFVTDFDRGSRDLGRATTIRYSGGSYTCDAMAEIAGPEGASRLVVFEVERGTEHEHLTPFREKLSYLRAHAEDDLINGAHEIAAPARFAIIFQSAKMRDLAQRSWPDAAAPIWGKFFVKSYDELAPFNTGWWYPGSREQRPLFSWALPREGQTTKPLPAA